LSQLLYLLLARPDEFYNGLCLCTIRLLVNESASLKTKFIVVIQIRNRLIVFVIGWRDFRFNLLFLCFSLSGAPKIGYTCISELSILWVLLFVVQGPCLRRSNPRRISLTTWSYIRQFRVFTVLTARRSIAILITVGFCFFVELLTLRSQFLCLVNSSGFPLNIVDRVPTLSVNGVSSTMYTLARRDLYRAGRPGRVFCISSQVLQGLLMTSLRKFAEEGNW
jgi:hypothetical protein